MSKETAKKITWLITGLLFLVAVGCLTRYYLYFSETNLAVVKTTTERTYKKLHPEWLNPSVKTMLESVQSEQPDELYLMTIQAALGRYKLIETAPKAYSTFLNDLRSGWWNDDVADELTPALQEIDLSWIAARKAVLDASTTKSLATLTPHHTNGLLMEFTPGVKTAELGAVMEATFAVLPGSESVTYGEAIWTTKRLPDVAPWRVRACPVEKTGETSGTLLVYRLTMDMSDSPIWLNPDTEPAWIHFRAPAQVKWAPITFTFSETAAMAMTGAEKNR